MTRRYIPLNSLRTFGAAARQLSFTKAAIELNVIHAAIGQQVRALEKRLHCHLFIRASRGLVLTAEGESLLPVLNESFNWIANTLDRFSTALPRVKIRVGVVGTFATGFYSLALTIFTRSILK